MDRIIRTEFFLFSIYYDRRLLKTAVNAYYNIVSHKANLMDYIIEIAIFLPCKSMVLG